MMTRGARWSKTRDGMIISADRIFCNYLAESEVLVREHSRLAGFPITKITEVPTIIGPMTAYD
jgi:hypothetical protein